MIAAIRRRLDEKDEGFTLIELLVVVIIIGILAAIAIPTFLNQRNRGWEADAQSNVRNAAIAQQSWFTGSADGYGTMENLRTEGFTQSPSVTVATTGDASRYCIIAQHNSGGSAFVLQSSGTTAGQIVREARMTTPACTLPT